MRGDTGIKMACNNFSLVSDRDALVYGSCRPGYAKDNETPGAVRDEDVEAWCKFMHEKVVGFCRFSYFSLHTLSLGCNVSANM